MTLSRQAITTDRLRLEPMRADFASLTLAVAEASQAEFTRWFAWAGRSLPERSRQHAEETERQWGKGAAYNFAVFRDDELVGDIGLRLNQNNPLLASIGYWMGTAWAGNGYMTEAARAVRDLGFDVIGLVRLELGVGVENGASCRVAEKLGMRREGLMRAAALNGDQQPYDLYLYSMLRDDPRDDTGERYAAGPRAAVEAITKPDFSRGLITAVVQQEDDGQVLMVAHMNEEAYEKTLETGRAWFWSRSREKLWEKGETSGNYLDVRAVTLDCDGDAVLLRVSPHGPSCHTGAWTCFHNPMGQVGAGR